MFKRKFSYINTIKTYRLKGVHIFKVLKEYTFYCYFNIFYLDKSFSIYVTQYRSVI